MATIQKSVRYEAAIDGAAKEELELLGAEGERYTLSMRGKLRSAEARRLPGGALHLLLDDESYEFEVTEQDGSFELLREGRRYHVNIDDARRAKLKLTTASHSPTAQGRQQIRSPMPGRVVRIAVQVGDTVEQDQGVVVVEAMKMENELRATAPGKVVEVLVQEGATVEGGKTLLVLE